MQHWPGQFDDRQQSKMVQGRAWLDQQVRLQVYTHFHTTGHALLMEEVALARWTPADLEQTFQNPFLSEEERKNARSCSRQWIIWHVLEFSEVHI